MHFPALLTSLTLAWTLSPAVIGGSPALASRDEAVVSLSVKKGAVIERCTGVLVDADLVLTAWHCVAAGSTGGVACDVAGRSLNGDQVGAEVDAEDVVVRRGARPELDEVEGARARAIVHPEGSVFCNADIAVVVLDRRLSDVKPARVRLEGGVAEGDRLEVVGFGSGSATDVTPGARMTATLDVRAVGRRVSPSGTALGGSEFETGRGTCRGDSGGPTFDEASGAVVGVVSRGADCVRDEGNVHVMPSGHVRVLRQALRLTGGRVVGEDGRILHEERVAARALDTGVGEACAASPRSPSSSRSLGAGAAIIGLALALGARRGRRGAVPFQRGEASPPRHAPRGHLSPRCASPSGSS